MKWRPFWGIIKNARFHPTKHLSQWVSSQLEIGNLLFFGADRDFRLFLFPMAYFPLKWPPCPCQMVDWGQPSKKQTQLLVGQRAEILAPDNILWFFPQTEQIYDQNGRFKCEKKLHWNFMDQKWPPPPHLPPPQFSGYSSISETTGFPKEGPRHFLICGKGGSGCFLQYIASFL